MYYIVLLILLFCSVFEIYYKRISSVMFVLIYFIMTLMAVFRFGQLGDYFAYWHNYTYPEEIRDYLFLIYVSIFKFFDADYTIFTGVTELICMGVAFPFFFKSCKHSAGALLAFYCYTYMVCPMSALRQAMCLSILLCSFSLLVEKKRLSFYILVVIGCFIHISFFSVFFIGLLCDRHFFNKSWMVYVLILASLLSVFTVDTFSSFRVLFDNRSVDNELASDFDNIIQLTLRLILLIPLLFSKPEYGDHGYYAKAICMVGYLLYCFLAVDVFIAGRLEYYFRTFICLFIAYLSNQNRSFYRTISMYLFIFVHIALFFKNINGFIWQGDYNKDVTMFNFPYISVFDKSEIGQYTTMDQFGYAE